MAAEKLEQTAKELGHEIKVETQGAMGIENELNAKDISNAAAVIFAVDIAIEAEERFTKLPRVKVPVQDALKDPLAIFEKVNALVGKKG
jgi:PTS system fructose-specific IIB component/fructose-specific PTS system IIB-like component